MKLEGAAGTILRLAGSKGEPMAQSVAVKGDRKLTVGDSSGELVDLAAEKIYRLDPKARTYQVTTFEELRKKARSGAKQESRPGQAEGPAESDTEVDLDVKQTGQRKTLNGFDTHQVITTVTIRKKGKTLEQGGGTVITADQWLTGQAKALGELASFDRRYLEKLYGKEAATAAADALAALATAGLPGVGLGMEKMRDAGKKLDGHPVLSTTTVEKARSAAELAPKEEEPASRPTDLGSLGGLFAKAVAKKAVGEKKVEPRETLMTTTQELISVSTAVTEADVALPAGFVEKR